MVKEEIKNLIEKAVAELKKKQEYSRVVLEEVSVDYPNERARGDYSTNVAFKIAKDAAVNPFEAATVLKQEIEKQNSKLIKEVEVVNGFVNFFISEDYLQNKIGDILKQKAKYGSLKAKKEKINVEFISANPTGPMTLGNGRGGFCGDVLANTLEKAGYKVTREYYINDTGAQIKKLGHSVLGDQEAVYKGDYILQLKSQIKEEDPEKNGEQAAKIILEKMIKPSVKKMGINFDVWFSEKNLYKKKEVDKAIEGLSKKGLTYESEGAVWFKSKDLGDDKDRVLVRADGIKTYFSSDIAYLQNKFARGFSKLIMFLGADHYGYVPRLKAAAHAFGFQKDSVDAVVMQLVRLMENGKEVRMSKRTGIYVAIDELIDEVGLDAARFFFLMVNPNTHMNFDLSLAKERSEKNPVFKVQYAHARICSILKKAGAKQAKIKKFLLKEPSEIDLMTKLIKLPEIVESVSKDYQVQRLPQYALELAEAFHRFYENCRVICEDKEMSQCRQALILATKTVLKNTLDLMGVSAPEQMERNAAK